MSARLTSRRWSGSGGAVSVFIAPARARTGDAASTSGRQRLSAGQCAHTVGIGATAPHSVSPTDPKSPPRAARRGAGFATNDPDYSAPRRQLAKRLAPPIFLTIVAVCAIFFAQVASASKGCPANAKSGSLNACIIGKGTAAGDYATTVATGSLSAPSSASIVVYTSTPQLVDIAWTTVCARGFGAGSKSGQRPIHTFADAGPLDNIHGAWTIVGVKFAMARSDSCTISASVQLSASGTLRVFILGLHR